MSSGDIGQIFGSAFSSGQYEPMTDFEPLPPGKYQVVIEKAEVRDTKAGTGRYIWLEMIVVNDPKFNNRKLWTNINIFNPSTQCVEIGLRVLEALRQAANVSALEDSSQLVGCSVVAHVKVKDGQNNVRTYSAIQQVQPVHEPVQPIQPTYPGQQTPPSSSPMVQPGPQPPVQPQQPVQTSSPSKLPWTK